MNNITIEALPELQMLSNATFNCQVRMSFMNLGSQLSVTKFPIDLSIDQLKK